MSLSVHAMPIADRMKTQWMMVCQSTPSGVSWVHCVLVIAISAFIWASWSGVQKGNPFKAPAAMTRLAGGLPVRPEQREAGLLLVVELRIGPGGLRVAAAAVGAALAAVHVIGRMATGAGGRRRLPEVAGMAGGARNLRMARLEWKPGL